ncbi:MAG: hypothetical protein M1536_06245, partial [Firmicutes bacterium]|nr:hypothetical protein [Bacillota bacterium]
SIGILNVIMIIWLVILCIITQLLAYRKGVHLVKSHHSYTYIRDVLIKKYAPRAALVLFLISVGIWMFIFVKPPWVMAIPFKFIFLTAKKYIASPGDMPDLRMIFYYINMLITVIISALVLMIVSSVLVSSVAKIFSKAKVFTGIIQSN